MSPRWKATSSRLPPVGATPLPESLSGAAATPHHKWGANRGEQTLERSATDANANGTKHHFSTSTSASTSVPHQRRRIYHRPRVRYGVPQKFILICATGRSGSTTLQRILATIPDSNICGENFGTTNALLEAYVHLKEARQKTMKSNCKFMTPREYDELHIKPALYNVFNFEDMKSRIRSALLAMMDDRQQRRVLGFKEIRYIDKMHLLDAFSELFPNTKIVCHIREDVAAQSKSAWWASDPSAAYQLAMYNQQIKAFATTHQHPDNPCMLTTFDDLFDVAKMRQLFCFLGEPFDETQWREIMADSRE